MSSLHKIVFGILLLGAAYHHVTGGSSGCNDEWNQKMYNTHKPSPSNGNDTEPMPDKKELDAVCSPGTGTLIVQCDDGKEPFTGDRDDANIKATCNIQDGMHCVPHNINGTCPDFSIQIGCCRIPTASPLPSTKQHSTTGTGNGSTSQNVSNIHNGVTGNPTHVTTHGGAANTGQNSAKLGQNDDNGSKVCAASIGILLVGFLGSIWLAD